VKWNANLMASRILIAAGLYIQSQVNANSALRRLINECFGVTDANYLDEEDQKICYQTAAELINSPDALTHLNSELWTLSKRTFSKEEWEKFVTFIKKQELTIMDHKPQNHYPVTTLIQPLFKSAFEYVGTTIGWVVAETVNSSSPILSPQVQLSSFTHSLVLGASLGVVGSSGTAILASAVGAKIVHNFCKTNLPNLSGTALGCVGKGTGLLLGLPFDLAYNFFRITKEMIVQCTKNTSDPLCLSGIQIADGVVVLRGNPMYFKLFPNIVLPQIENKSLQITKKGEIFMEKNQTNLKEPMDLVIEELKAKFAVPPNNTAPNPLSPTCLE
jgi:hypothetical protein